MAWRDWFRRKRGARIPTTNSQGERLVCDFSALQEHAHMLQWLSEEPFVVIAAEVEVMLQRQIPATSLRALRATSPPEWLTGARPAEGTQLMQVTRAGMAVAIELHTENPETGHELETCAVFTWVGRNLDSPQRRDRMWLDVDGDMGELGSKGALLVRIYMDDEA